MLPAFAADGFALFVNVTSTVVELQPALLTVQRITADVPAAIPVTVVLVTFAFVIDAVPLIKLH